MAKLIIYPKVQKDVYTYLSEELKTAYYANNFYTPGDSIPKDTIGTMSTSGTNRTIDVAWTQVQNSQTLFSLESTNKITDDNPLIFGVKANSDARGLTIGSIISSTFYRKAYLQKIVYPEATDGFQFIEKIVITLRGDGQ